MAAVKSLIAICIPPLPVITNCKTRGSKIRDKTSAQTNNKQRFFIKCWTPRPRESVWVKWEKARCWEPENPNLNLKSELQADVGMLSSRSLRPECVHCVWTLPVETSHDVSASKKKVRGKEERSSGREKI